MSARLESMVPEAAAAFVAVSAAVRALDLHQDPAIDLFEDQFQIDVTMIDDDLRRRFLAATGPMAFEVAQAIWVADYWPRVAITIGAVLGGDSIVTPPPVEPVELWPAIEEFMRAVARLDALDPVLTELVRLRGAQQHNCRLCRSRRSVAAIGAGADEGVFAQVEDYAASDLPEATKAALALVDAVIWTPYHVPDETSRAAARLLTPEQVVEVVLDVTRNSANKIAVALGADAPAVESGVELFATDADGNLTIVGVEDR